MESERMPHGNALRDLQVIQARAAGMPRGHAGLQLGYTVLFAAYVAVLVYTGSIEGGRNLAGGPVIALVLPPIIISSGLISGANERFGARRRATARQGIVLGICLLVLVLGVLVVWGPAGEGYPWWVSLVCAAATMVIVGARPLVILLRKDAPLTEPREPTGLARPARVTTVLIGVYFGLLSGSVLTPMVTWLTMMLGMMAAIIALGAQASSWGLLRTGYEWRAAQWAGFSIATTVMFALAVLIIATGTVTPAVAVIAGLVVAASVIAPALMPRRVNGTPAP